MIWFISNRSARRLTGSDYSVDQDDRYVDLVDLTQALQTLGDVVLTEAAAEVANQINNFTIAAHHRSGYLPPEQNNLFVDLDAAHGLGIYYPSSTAGSIFTDYTSHALFQTITAGWGWVDFLVEGVQPLSGQSPPDERTLLAPIQPSRSNPKLYLPISAR